MPDNRPILTDTVDLIRPIDTIKRTLIVGTDCVIRLAFVRGSETADLTGSTVKLKMLGDNDGTPWVRYFDAVIDEPESGIADVEITRAEFDLAGTLQGQVIATDDDEYESIWQLYEIRAVARLNGTPTPPVQNVIDWSEYTGYLNTATHGPVRPHSGTLEVKATNADGSISIGVKDGLYDPAGAAAAAQAAAEAASLPLGGTAADVNPAGTQIAGEFQTVYGEIAAKADDSAVVKLTGDQTVQGVKAFDYASPDTFARLIVGDAARAGTRGYSSTTSDAASTFQSLNRSSSASGEATRALVTNNVGQWKDGLLPTASTPEAGAWTIRDLVANLNRFWVSIVDGFVNAVIGLKTPIVRAPSAASLAVQDNAGTPHATISTSGIALDQLTASRATSLDANKRIVTLSAADHRALIGAAALTPTVNAQVGTTYTLAATDAGAIVTATNGSAITVTLPPNSSIPLAVGTIVNIVKGGAGVVTIEGGTGVTVNGVSEGDVDIGAQYQGATCLKIATDTWIISGAIS
jgi:hypothetical protein